MTTIIKKEDIKKLRMDLKKYGYSLKTQSLNDTKSFIFVYKDNKLIEGLFNIYPKDLINNNIDMFDLLKLYKIR